MDEPMYPSVQGQQVPNLGLAQYSVSTPKTAIYTNDDSTGPMLPIVAPPLTGDASSINQMGIDPGVPYFDLKLANEFDVMTPAQLAAPNKTGEVVGPTFSAPDMCIPALKMADLGADEIEHHNEWAPDPTLPDLLDFGKPGGLDIIAASSNPLAIDPMAPDLDEYDRPAGLGMPGPLTADPAVPDLQQPELEQEVHMSDRPGDLASDALGEMHDDETYKELPTENYKELYMAQDGNNQRRERHMGMMNLGLDKEEKGKR